MKFKLFVLMALVLSLQCNSQTLKIRLEIGEHLGFSSFGEGVFTKFYEKPLYSPYFSLYNRVTTNEDLPQWGIMLEYQIKERFHIETGFLFYESAMMRLESRVWNGWGTIDSSTYEFMAPGGLYVETGPVLTKVPLHFSYDFNNFNSARKINVVPSVLFGINYVRRNDGPLEPSEIGGGPILTMPDHVYPDSFYIEKISLHATENKNTFSAILGTQVRFYWKKRELFSLKLFYEQGFYNWEFFKYEMWRDQKYFTHNVYTKGSALYFKISVPITIKKFGGKKQIG
ncbi:MAG: hypothetical protein K9H64_05295 [Bacteroidales bacterium]|nr:hypothetical protein [Bacteroidales bacterium]MCF8455254.1 hypothetical protein [Bacteroidales bacterium]